MKIYPTELWRCRYYNRPRKIKQAYFLLSTFYNTFSLTFPRASLPTYLISSLFSSAHRPCFRGGIWCFRLIHPPSHMRVDPTSEGRCMHRKHNVFSSCFFLPTYPNNHFPIFFSYFLLSLNLWSSLYLFFFWKFVLPAHISMEVYDLITQTKRCVRLELPPNQVQPFLGLNLLVKLISFSLIGLSIVKDSVHKA